MRLCQDEVRKAWPWHSAWLCSQWWLLSIIIRALREFCVSAEPSSAAFLTTLIPAQSLNSQVFLAQQTFTKHLLGPRKLSFSSTLSQTEPGREMLTVSGGLPTPRIVFRLSPVGCTLPWSLSLVLRVQQVCLWQSVVKGDASWKAVQPWEVTCLL